ncbi:hypothetical protein ACFLXC_07220 [Chloroflexota bacterium]
MQGKAFEKWPPLQKRFAVTETIAHLECLRREGRLSRLNKGGRFLYQAV